MKHNSKICKLREKTWILYDGISVKALNLSYLWLIWVGDFTFKNSINIADPQPPMDVICKVERFMVSLYDTLGIIYLRVCQNKSAIDLGYYSISQW